MRFTSIIALVLLSGLVFAASAMAGQGTEIPEWRYWWDVVWRILNFLILAFFLVKMAKQPLKEFLSGQRKAVEEEIVELEQARSQAQAELEKWLAKANNLEKELADYEQALAEVARKQQEGMLADAEAESRRIMDRARIWADQALRKARQRLAAEIVEMAGQLAVEKLQSAMTAEDRARLIQKFAEDIESSRAA